MKKIIFFSFFLGLLLNACYDDYKSDYIYTAAYFSYQHPVRTVIIDPESDVFKIKVGATYGGRYSYDGASESVFFSIEDTLVNNNQDYLDMGIKVMPSSWYSLSSDDEIKIENSNVGFVEVSIIKDSLIKYPDATLNTYAIPFLITEATTDSVLSGKNYSIVVVKFKNEFDGRYYVKGVDYSLNADGTKADTSIYSNEALVLNKYIYLNTISKDEVSISRIGNNQDGENFVYNMKIRSSDGTAILSANPNSVVQKLVGAATYDFKEKTFYCNYNYEYNGVEHSVVDTLIYSNTEIKLEEWN